MAAPIPFEPRQARSRATHRRLLAATAACLVREGYAGTTTTAVCRRARVSQGALFQHFPTKAALLAATAAHVFEQLVGEYRRGFAELSGRPDREAGAVRLLWQIFNRPALAAALELMVAGRGDPELAAALAPVQAAHGANLRRLARELFPDVAAADPRAFENVLDLLLSAMQGAVLGNLTRPDAEADARRLDFLERLVRDRFASVRGTS